MKYLYVLLVIIGCNFFVENHVLGGIVTLLMIYIFACLHVIFLDKKQTPPNDFFNNYKHPAINPPWSYKKEKTHIEKYDKETQNFKQIKDAT